MITIIVPTKSKHTREDIIQLFTEAMVSFLSSATFSILCNFAFSSLFLKEGQNSTFFLALIFARVCNGKLKRLHNLYIYLCLSITLVVTVVIIININIHYEFFFRLFSFLFFICLQFGFRCGLLLIGFNYLNRRLLSILVARISLYEFHEVEGRCPYLR